MATELQGIVGGWKRSDVSPDKVFDTLSAVVFCRARPGEILIYPKPVSETGTKAPVSVGQ